MNKVKILTISSSGFDVRDGIGTVLYDYFTRFDFKRFEIHLAVAGKYNYEVVKKFEKIGIIIKFLPSRNKEVFKYFNKLIMLIKKEDYDIIYTNGSSALLSIDLLAAKLAGCRCRIVHSHNTKCDHPKLDWILRPLLYTLYTDAFACGKEAGKWLFKNRKFRIVRNGRSVSKYRYNSAIRKKMRIELSIPDGCIAVGHVGNFNEQKNQAFLVDIFSEILKRDSNFKLFLIGDGSKRKALEDIVKENKIESNVIFVGSTDNVPQFLQAMDLMVLPSLYEGLPLVVVEWQLCGLPTLISTAVTNECVFTNLVEFEDLAKGSTVWADHIFNMKKKSFPRDDISIIKNARDTGYDIDKDAIELQNYLIKLVIKQ